MCSNYVLTKGYDQQLLQAAKWRQAQRAQQFAQRQLILWEAEPWDDNYDNGNGGDANGIQTLNLIGRDGGDDTQEQKNSPSSVVSGLASLWRGDAQRNKKKETKISLRDRVEGVLAQDREDAWDSDNQ